MTIFQNLQVFHASLCPLGHGGYIEKYGTDWELIFRISAKKEIKDNEIKGPSVFKNDKDVEYTIFLPFDIINLSLDVPKLAIEFLLKGCCEVFRELGINTEIIENKSQSIIEDICSDAKMFK
nr:hypothetical protein [uncultured Desulfobacter sp.]